jgi:hypothetical protein
MTQYYIKHENKIYNKKPEIEQHEEIGRLEKILKDTEDCRKIEIDKVNLLYDGRIEILKDKIKELKQL